MTVDGIVEQYVCIGSETLRASSLPGRPHRPAPTGLTFDMRFQICTVMCKQCCRGETLSRPRNIACIARGTLRASPAEHCVHRPRNIACGRDRVSPLREYRSICVDHFARTDAPTLTGQYSPPIVRRAVEDRIFGKRVGRFVRPVVSVSARMNAMMSRRSSAVRSRLSNGRV